MTNISRTKADVEILNFVQHGWMVFGAEIFCLLVFALTASFKPLICRSNYRLYPPELKTVP